MFPSSFFHGDFHALVLADQVSPLFLLFLAPFFFLFFFEDILLLLRRDSSCKNFAFVEENLMGRIKVGTMKGKRLYGVCGMLGRMECVIFNVNESLPSMIWWRLENQSLMNE
jgi:hypothetical protein